MEKINIPYSLSTTNHGSVAIAQTSGIHRQPTKRRKQNEEARENGDSHSLRTQMHGLRLLRRGKRKGEMVEDGMGWTEEILTKDEMERTDEIGRSRLNREQNNKNNRVAGVAVR